ncbi:MAG: TonB-dependent receptor family protein [Francisellaceae bacterium]
MMIQPIKPTLQLVKIGALAAAGLSLPIVSMADNNSESTNNDNTQKPSLVVNGSWLGNSSDKDVKTYPGARSVVTQQQIVDSGVTNVEDAMRSVPSVRILDEDGGTGVLPNISVRGLNPKRSEDTQILVNGIPLALAPYSQTGISLFPVTLDTVERIDVVRGGAAVQYGPNNVGGVINIITKPIPNKRETVLKQSETFAPGGNILSTSYGRVGGFITDNFGAQLQASITRGNGDRQHSNTQINNFILDTDYWPTLNTELKTNTQYYNADAELPGSLTPREYENNWRQSVTPYDNYDSHTFRTSAVLSHDFDQNNNLSLTTYYQQSYRNFTWGNPTNVADPTTDIMQSPRDFKTFGLEPKYSSTFTLGVKQKVLAGIRYIYEDIFYPVYKDPLNGTADSTTRQWSMFSNDYAAYISDTLYFDEDKLQLTPGIRYENINQNFSDQINATNSTVNNTHTFLPGLTVGYDALDWLYLFTNAQRSLKAPQLSAVANSGGGDLQSERAWNYEIGSRLTMNSQLSTTVTAFRTDYSDKLDRIQNNEGLWVYQNVGKSVEQGIETLLSYNPSFLKELTLDASYTYLYTKIEEGQYAGNQLPYAPHSLFSFIGNYSYHSWNYNLSGHFTGASFSDAANTTVENADGTEGPIPSYWLWNIAVTKEFRIDDTTRFKASASINNIFDKRYFMRGVDVSANMTPGTGRTFTLTGELKF